MGAQVVFAEVFAALWQLMMLQIGQHFLELEEEAFAGFVVIGEHVEFS